MKPIWPTLTCTGRAGGWAAGRHVSTSGELEEQAVVAEDPVASRERSCAWLRNPPAWQQGPLGR